MRNSVEKVKGGPPLASTWRFFDILKLISLSCKNRKKIVIQGERFQSKRWMAFSDDVFSPCRNNLEGAAQH